MRRAKRDSRRITYMLTSPMVRSGESLSLLASARRLCDFAGAPATRKSGENPSAGGFSVRVSPSRCRIARCEGPEGKWILLSVAEPTELSPGCSHSRPTSASQPSGLRRSARCCSRQTAFSFCQPESCARAEHKRSADRRSVFVALVMRLRELMRHYSPCAVLTDSCDGSHRRDEGIAVTYRQAPLKRLARYECANVAPLQ